MRHLLAALALGALSVTGASAAPPTPGAIRVAGGWAVPISARTSAAVPPGTVSPGIGPGTWLASFGLVEVTWCTASFVFVKNGVYGLGTAGHCAANDALGGFPDVTAYVVPPVGQGLPGFYHIGKFVLSHNNGIGDDFAMIEIYPQYNSWINPAMPVWGGPANGYLSNDPTPVVYYGHPAGAGTPGAGYAPVMGAYGGRVFAWYGSDSDAGTPVESATRLAVGTLTHVVISDGSGEIPPGTFAGIRMSAMLAIASGWTLVTPPPLP